MSFKLPYSWGEMAAGKGNDWARDLAQKMGQLDGPVWLAFHHEPEYDGDIADWTAMQEELGPIVRNQGNLAFTVIVTGYHQFYGEEQFSLANMWPKGIKVDVAGFDIYNQMGVVKDGKKNTKGTNLQEPTSPRSSRGRSRRAWSGGSARPASRTKPSRPTPTGSSRRTSSSTPLVA